MEAVVTRKRPDDRPNFKSGRAGRAGAGNARSAEKKKTNFSGKRYGAGARFSRVNWMGRLRRILANRIARGGAPRRFLAVVVPCRHQSSGGPARRLVVGESQGGEVKQDFGPGYPPPKAGF